MMWLLRVFLNTGAPKQILSDNGSEFNKQEFHELGELLNMEVKTTGAESPWSNEITERHNGIIGNMIDKILHDFLFCGASIGMGRPCKEFFK